MKLARLTASLLLAALAVGCTTTSTVTLLSTKNVDLSADHEVVARSEKSKYGRLWLLFIPLGGEPNVVEEANSLLEKHQGDFLTNVVVDSTGWSIIAFSYGAVTVKGDVWQRHEATPPAPEAPPAPEPEEAAGETPSP